jgi:hypothetical protein
MFKKKMKKGKKMVKKTKKAAKKEAKQESKPGEMFNKFAAMKKKKNEKA